MSELQPLITSEYTNVTRIYTLEDVENILMPFLYLNGDIGLDVETTPDKEFFVRKMRTIQFGTKERQFVIDLRDFVPNRCPAMLYQCQGNFGSNLDVAPKLKELLLKLSLVLCSNKWLKIGVNLGFEYTCFYWGFGLRPWNFYDCAMVERVKVAGIHSLEDYGFFSMEEMVARYFGMQIDKSLQMSFNLTDELTQAQFEYAALDTRVPIGLRARQLGGYYKDGVYTPVQLGYFNPDEVLLRTYLLENDAIPAFEDMHIHGEKLDTAAWNKRIDGLVEKRKEVFAKLDAMVGEHVGFKKDIVPQEEVDALHAQWKAIKDTKDLTRAKLKMQWAAKRKKRSEQLKLAEGAQGEALVNYGSPTMMLKVFNERFGLELDSTDDDDLKKYEGEPVIDAFRDFRELDKQISTYGYSWTKEWTTHPCNEEGWLSPYTHKLHSRYNQLAAETGRSSSDNPNGQNLPQSKDVRKCFIAEVGECYVTADMSGAELRIIADLSNAPSWVDAFARGEDLHSVGCEILFPHEWPQNACNGELIEIKKGQPEPYWCEYYKLHDEASVKKNPLGTIGQPMHYKCECPKHKERRNKTKAANFLIAYGGTYMTLAVRTGMPEAEAEQLMLLHEETFPDVHGYLTKSGKRAVIELASYDMYGRRRLFPKPTRERAIAQIKEYNKDQLKLPKAVCEARIAKWKELHKFTVIGKNGKEITKYPAPKGEDKVKLIYREPNEKEIERKIKSLTRSIERQGKNHAIQGTNASVAKVAMGAGFDKDGKPYLWHVLPQYKARIVKFVHDELVIACPQEHGQTVAALIGDAFRRAAAEVMHKVVMEFEYKVAPYWSK